MAWLWVVGDISLTPALSRWEREAFAPGVVGLTAPLKRVHLKDQIMDKMKGGRNAKKRS